MSDVTQRPYWNGESLKLRELWIVRKTREGRAHFAVCMLFSHLFGWELRLLIDGELQRSQVCCSEEEWLDTGDAWKAAMAEKGWT